MRQLSAITTIIFLFISCSKLNENKVYLFKQWHLAPHDRTLDLEESKSLPQFTNQVDIYTRVAKLIESGKTKIVLAEGCQGEIRPGFSKIFNGWSLSRLKRYTNKANFHEILAPIPMKLKAKYPKLIVLCGDNDELIKENQKAMSDLRGFAGFYSRLLEFQSQDKVKFKVYAHQLKKLYPQEKIDKPIEYSLKRALNSLKLFERIIVARNQGFFNLAKKHLKQNPVIIIGGLHVNDLKQRFDSESIKNEVIIPKGYSEDGNKLIQALKKNLNQGAKQLIKLFQVPSGFQLEQFVFKNPIKANVHFTDKELSHMQSLIEGKIPEALLYSDYDGDGIRDFTVSQNGELLIVSAEDPDWDNDGVSNLKDTTLDKKVISQSRKLRVDNHYSSTANIEDIKTKLTKKLTLLTDSDIGHELIVLELYLKLTERFKQQQFKVKHLVAKDPVFTYGENTFFSYVAQSESLEYYPKKLHKYINEKYQSRFKGADYNKFVNSFVVPLIVHSMGHELAHSLQIDEFPLAKKAGWSWSEKSYEGKYLAKARTPSKVIKTLRSQVKLHGKAYKDWIEDYDLYTKNMNKELKEKPKKPIHKFNFLATKKLPSIYAAAKPEEWFAEMYSMCLYQKIYPETLLSPKRSIELEHLLGINPLAPNKDFCLRFAL